MAAKKEMEVMAVCYGPGLYGNKTANGTTLTRSTKGVAHLSWPLETELKLTIASKQVRVKVIDRGPYTGAASLDVTEATAQSLGFKNCKHFGRRKVIVNKENN